MFINQATGYLTIDIINAFSTVFDKVALITGSIRIQDTRLNSKVKVTKIIKYNRGGDIRKGCSWLFGTLQIWFLLMTRYKDFERFYFTIPPTAYLLALHQKTPYSVAVFDLYPEALLAKRFSKLSMGIFKWWADQNRRIFGRARMLFTLSDDMHKQIKKYSPDSDIRVIPNWSAFSRLKRIEKHQNTLIQKNGLQGKFVVQYSGNIGASHNVEVLIDVAERLIQKKDILFLIIGRGERSEVIGELIGRKNLTNCLLLPFRKDEELYDSLCAADLAVITLDDRLPDISVPSKIYNIMAAGTPIMAIASPVSGVAGIISRHKIGKVIDRRDINGMCQFIEKLINNPVQWKLLSDNSLRASQDYSSTNAFYYLNYYNEKGS